MTKVRALPPPPLTIEEDPWTLTPYRRRRPTDYVVGGDTAPGLS